MNVVLIDYGAGNTRSLQNAFRKIGVQAKLSADPVEFIEADALVLPGVGNFGHAMKMLEEFRKPIQDYVKSGKPFLGVCLGIQAILGESMESPGTPGLKIIEGSCMKFEQGEGLKVPHMGWNSIKKTRETSLLEGVEDGEFFYFVHSYYPRPSDEGVVAAVSEYGVEFPCVISENNVHATQFHPERSGEKGLSILKNFVDTA